MIGWLSGVVRAREEDRLIVDVRGVGYVVTVPLGAGAHVAVDEPVVLHIHTHVREDAIALFGFETTGMLAAFEALITVSGVGPKLAMAIVGSLTPDQLAYAVDSGDIARLKQVPGVGKKMAERLTVELRGKLRGGGGPTGGRGPVAVRHGASDVWRDVESALLNLDYRPKEVDAAFIQLRAEHGDTPGFDALLRAALAWFRK